ncbi:nuclear cap-binding protein subunit 3 isoform X2 [Brienomyrus brachyistius]|uniref:nuclear cap-binding protein subunit 3 isoform X2 n=1 Tax=Brienomyrus brachyistius TaxID=42636 RepID=UPI0020B297F6|nr:nuclear cap-binding protein subunit 3 isoform X2 [Brienomyrus brachyistius]
MAAVRSLRVSVKPEAASDRPDSDSDSDSERDAREPEPMEVEEGEIETESEAVPVRRALKEFMPEAVEKKEQRARRFHFRAEVNLAQRNVVLDRDMMKKAIPKLRAEALYVCGVDEMSTQDVFGYFKEYPPAHIEWIDDTSCNVVWLDDNTSTRALINISRMPDAEAPPTVTASSPDGHQPAQERRARGERDSDDEEEEEEGEVDDEDESAKEGKCAEEKAGENKDDEDQAAKNAESDSVQSDPLSQAEKESLLRNDLRPAIRPFAGNKLFLRFATHDDKKELGAARRSRYYMKYGNPNYGGMKGILSNSWKRRFHTRKIQRDVLRTKKPLIGDSMGHTPPYTHRHSDLVNLPEEPIEEEEEEEEDGEEDMDSDDRVVEYWGEKERERFRDRERDRGKGPRKPAPTSGSSDSDEMDYDLELKMISTPSPKKSMKMTMYADEVESNLKSLRNSTRADSLSGSSLKNRIGSGSGTKAEKVTDVRQLLEEKRQGLSQQRPPVASSGKTDVRQRLGKRPHSPESRRSPSPSRAPQRDPPPRREPLTDVRSRLGVPKREPVRQYSETAKDSKSGSLWSRLGTLPKDREPERKEGAGRGGRGGQQGEEDEEDSDLQKVWGAMIKEKEEQSHKKKSRLDSLPSLQIEISRESNSSDSES